MSYKIPEIYKKLFKNNETKKKKEKEKNKNYLSSIYLQIPFNKQLRLFIGTHIQKQRISKSDMYFIF